MCIANCFKELVVMARMARFKISDVEAYYHVHSRTVGIPGEFNLSNPLAQRKLLDSIKHYSQAYFVEIAGFCVMGNHYHLILKCEASREVGIDELKRRAHILYPSEESKLAIELWPQEKWDRLHKRLFDLSEFMRNVQSDFARWY